MDANFVERWEEINEFIEWADWDNGVWLDWNWGEILHYGVLAREQDGEGCDSIFALSQQVWNL